MKGLLKKTVDGLQAAIGSSHKIVQRFDVMRLERGRV